MSPETLQGEMDHAELKRKLMHEFSEADRWGWLADALRNGNTRMDFLERKCAPCAEWHVKVLKLLLGIVITGAGAAFMYLMGLVGKHIFGG